MYISIHMYWNTEYILLFLRLKVMSPLQISKSTCRCHAWSCFMMMNWPKWLLYLWMIWTDFVAEVKDKDSKVGEALCDVMIVMTKCCVTSGRAGQSQSTSRELWLTGKCSVAAWLSHSEHGDTGDARGRDDQSVSDPGDTEVPGGDQQGGGRERQVLSVEDAEDVFKDPCVPKVDKCDLHRKFVGRSE